MKKRPIAIVTGGAGFIGSNLVDGLIKQDIEVIVIDDLSTGFIENINPKAKFYKANLIDLECLEDIFEKSLYSNKAWRLIQ